MSVSFGDKTYVGSYNYKAVLSRLSFSKEFYGNPAEIKKLPAYFESISNSGGTLSIHAEFADITLLSSSISSSSMYSNHMNITLSYSTLQFDAGYGTSFDLGYSVDEYWSILLTQGCLVNTNRNAYKPYLCGNGQYRFYACDRDQCNLHNTNTCSGFNGDYVINGSSSKSCYRFEGSASYYDSYPYSY